MAWMPSQPPSPLHDLALDLARLLARDLARQQTSSKKQVAPKSGKRPS
jgi:hypothetical protein